MTSAHGDTPVSRPWGEESEADLDRGEDRYLDRDLVVPVVRGECEDYSRRRGEHVRLSPVVDIV